MAINDNTLNINDDLAVFRTSQDDVRKANLVKVTDAVASNLTHEWREEQIYYRRSTSVGTTFNVPSGNKHTIIIYNNVNVMTIFSLRLPAVATVVDGQTVTVFYQKAVNTIVMIPNGALAVVGAPTVANAFDHYTLTYCAATEKWHRTV